MEFNKQLDHFYKKLNKNAPIIGLINNELGQYFYPYKPALIIAILTTLQEKSFNNPIKIDKVILKRYYDLLTTDVDLYEFLNQQKSKTNWSLELCFNENNIKKLINHIFEMPASKMADKNNCFWEINNHEKTILMNVPSDINLTILKNDILVKAYQVFKKCVPTYNILKDNEILAMDAIISDATFDENLQKVVNVNKRQYQHIFRKNVLDRDKKCVICCEDHPNLLEAAHIKPFSECKNNIERYDKDNGITLCANHHKLFDNHGFTFQNDWTIKIGNNLKEYDHYLKFKEFENCLELLKYSKSSHLNEYLSYRNNKYPV